MFFIKGDRFHPAPVDLENVTLSRELQVYVFLVFIICSVISVNWRKLEQWQYNVFKHFL